MEKEVAGVENVCPAFQAGCPFNKPELKDVIEEAKKCPAFKDDCTFKNAKTIQDVYEKLSQMPDVTEGSPHKKGLAEILKIIHSVSSELKGQLGDCPVFKSQTGCPFKTVCSDGEPLVVKLDNFNWESLIHSSAIQVGDELDAPPAKNTKDEEVEKQEASGVQLSTGLKKGTIKSHREAEITHFIKQFLKGKIEQKLYRQMVACLYFIYCALEEESDKLADHPIFGPLHCPKELSRVETLQEDLKFYYGDDWEDEIEISDAAQNYVDRLREIASSNPALMVSHHYTRYLGDLSGGQILKKLVKKFYDLPEGGDGVRFYEFNLIPDMAKFKDSYRKKLDSLNINREIADAMVEEANVAFHLNVNLFKELDVLAGFGEEFTHEEVEVEEDTAHAIPAGQSARVDDKHVTKTTSQDQSADERPTEEPNSAFDWLKIMAAVMIVVAVLFAFAANMMN